MYCVKCGAYLEDDSRFCTKCGAPQFASPEPAGSDKQPAVPVVPTIPATPAKATASPGSGINTKLVAIIAAVVVVVIVILAVVLLSGNGDSSFSQSQSAAASSSQASSSSSASAASDTSSSKDASAKSDASASGTSSKTSSSKDSSAKSTTSKSASSAKTDDYVLPDSATRYYSRSELEKMDLLDLYHARNEIYARHGRGFKNQDLQQYFNSKSWYKKLYTPEEFEKKEGELNDYERKNADLMLAVEKDRNSPYLK